MISTSTLPQPLSGHTKNDVAVYRDFFNQIAAYEKLDFEEAVKKLDGLARSRGTGTFFKEYARERCSYQYQKHWKEELESAQKSGDIEAISTLYKDVSGHKDISHLKEVAKGMLTDIIGAYKQTLETVIAMRHNFLPDLYELIKDECSTLCPVWLKGKVLKRYYMET